MLFSSAHISCSVGQRMSYSGPGHCRAYLTGNPECHVNVGDSAGSKWWVPFLFIFGVSHCSTSYI